MRADTHAEGSGGRAKKLIDGGHVEKLIEIGEDTFVSRVVITKKTDGSVKIAIDSVKQVICQTRQTNHSKKILANLS